MDKTLLEMLKRSMDRGVLEPDQIPDIDLYIDQIIALMEKSLGPQEDGQPPLTRTMIHNYSKAGLITPVKGKKYSREHIMEMFAIYSLKNTLSIAQIKRVLCALDEQEESSMSRGYGAYLERRELLREKAQDSLYAIMDDVRADDYENLYTRILLLADCAQMMTDYAKQLADRCYPEPPAKGKKK